jgi:hypothetical protein
MQLSLSSHMRHKKSLQQQGAEFCEAATVLLACYSESYRGEDFQRTTPASSFPHPFTHRNCD